MFGFENLHIKRIDLLKTEAGSLINLICRKERRFNPLLTWAVS